MRTWRLKVADWKQLDARAEERLEIAGSRIAKTVNINLLKIEPSILFSRRYEWVLWYCGSSKCCSQ